jgi:lipoprotein NlpI
LSDRARAAVLFFRGTYNLKRKNIARALTQLDDAITYRQDHAHTWCNRSAASLMLKNYERALSDATRAIELNPRMFEPYVNRGVASLYTGEYERALVDAKAAMLRCPADFRALSLMLQVHHAMHDPVAALMAVSQAITSQPKRDELYAARGEILFFLGEFADAAPDFRRGLQSRKLMTPTAVLLCYLAHARHGRDAKSQLRADMLRLRSKDWPVPVCRFYLGELTVDALLAATSKPEERGEAQFYIGQACLLQGDTVGAVRALRVATQLCPPAFVEHIGATAELQRLGMTVATIVK